MMKFTVAEEIDVPDFVYVVIFRGHPKNGNRVDAGRGELRRGLYCGDCFVQGVRRSAKKTNLLAADHSHRAGFQALQVFLGLRTTTKGNILGAQDSSNFTAAQGGIVQRFRISSDGIEGRSVGIERFKFREILDEIDEKL